MPLSPCKECGGALRRSRRNAVERLLYSEAYRCEHCRTRTRKLTWDPKNAHYVKCPRCHSVDLTVLKRRDSIDRMQRGFLNFLNKLGGGKLYHCWFCRLQFYDMRPRYDSVGADGETSPAQPEDAQKDLEIAS